MNENNCAVCRKPIIGYWHEVNNHCVCQNCAAMTTVYNLYMLDIIPIKPDIIEVESTLVTKGDEELKARMPEKSQFSAEYGAAVNATDDEVEKFFTSQEPVFTENHEEEK